MEIDQSSLFRDVEDVLNSGAKPVHYTWKAVLHVGGKDVEVMKVSGRDCLMEFDIKYAEETMLTLEMGLGTYAHQVYPNREKIDITLTRYPIGEVSDSRQDEQPMDSVRYTAVLVELGDIKLQGNGPNTPSEEALNLSRILSVEFQLINKTLEQLRTIAFGTNLRDVTVENAVKLVLTSLSEKVDVDATERPKGVNMVKASNEKKFDHVVFPHGLRLVQVPRYLQERYGIYSTDLGYFYHDGYWHLYPRYNTERFNDAANTVTIINVPKNRFMGTERTYKKVGSHVTILATSDVLLEDFSSSLQLNQGNGVRFADASKFMEGFTVSENNKTVASRAKNISEFIANKRDNDMNNVRFSDSVVVSNPYVEFSRLAERNGAYFSMRWENSDQSLIVPGMMAKILYLDGEDVKELYGSLLKVHHYDQLAGQGLVSTRYYSHSVLVFFVQRSLEK